MKTKCRKTVSKIIKKNKKNLKGLDVFYLMKTKFKKPDQTKELHRSKCQGKELSGGMADDRNR